MPIARAPLRFLFISPVLLPLMGKYRKHITSGPGTFPSMDQRKLIAGIGLVLIAALLCAGCTTTQSTPVNQSVPSSSGTTVPATTVVTGTPVPAAANTTAANTTAATSPAMPNSTAAAVTGNQTVTATATAYIEQDSASLSQGSSVSQAGATTLATIPMTQSSTGVPAAGTTMTQSAVVTTGTTASQSTLSAITTAAPAQTSTTQSSAAPASGITTVTTGLQTTVPAVQAPLQTPKADATQVPKPALPE